MGEYISTVSDWNVNFPHIPYTANTAEGAFREGLAVIRYFISEKDGREYIYDSGGRNTEWYIFCGCLSKETSKEIITFKFDECEVLFSDDKNKMILAVKNKITSIIFS